MATWENSDSSAEKHSNLCLMADIEKIISNLILVFMESHTHYAHRLMKMKRMIYLLRIFSPIVTLSLKIS